MSKRNDQESLVDIQEAIQRIQDYVRNIDRVQFMKDLKTQDAVVRNLEIIGEAVKNVSKSLQSKHKDIAWKDLAKVRDKLVHHYFGVNFDIVWNIIEESLPKIAIQINKILSE